MLLRDTFLFVKTFKKQDINRHKIQESGYNSTRRERNWVNFFITALLK